MQEMILVQQEAPRNAAERVTIESMRSDERILSIVVISHRNAVDTVMSDFEHHPIVSSFHVTDLLSNTCYTVTPRRDSRQISFTLGQREIVATLQPTADPVEVASFIGSHIETVASSN